MNPISNRPSSKLTSTMLTQIQENEYLRVKLIQLEKISRQKDTFYLSIFREQEKITEKVMSSLLLAESKIKDFVRERICNNWKDEYDNLAENITSYVKGVNLLIEQYHNTKKQLQEKAYNNNDLYEYYSNTLQECGKKFDQAQIIIEQLNKKIEDLKQTIVQLDDDLGQKMSIIEEQQQQIQVLNEELAHNQSQLQFLRGTKQSNTRSNESLRKTTKKLQKDNEALQRSNQQLSKLVNELRRQQDEDKIKRQALQQDLTQLELSIQTLNKKIMKNQKSQNEEQQPHKKQQKSRIFRKGDIQLVSMFESHNNSLHAIQTQNQKKFSNQNQLQLNKILQQQQLIKALTDQINYNKKTIQTLESQNKNLIQFQIQYISMENSYKRQFSQLKHKIITLNQQLEYKNQQINGLHLERTQIQQEGQDGIIQQQGLHEQIALLRKSLTQLQQKLENNMKQNDFLLKVNQEHQETIENLQKDKQQSKLQFQTLLHEFQQLVKDSDYEKDLELQQKRQSLGLCSFEVNQSFIISRNKIVSKVSMSQNSKMKKKNLLLSLEDHQTVKERQGLKQLNGQRHRKLEQQGKGRTKRFNLQAFQQKTNPQINVCWSPKVGDIYNALHPGRINGTSRW